MQLASLPEKIIRNFKKIIFPTSKDLAYKKWIGDNGENLLRYKYDLNENSVVVDVGGYLGDFAAELYSRYRCTLYVFEPVERFANYERNRFARNSNIKIFTYGLGGTDATLNIEADDNKTQMKAAAGKNLIQVHIRNFENVVRELEIKKVDLIKINIEGGEYELLDRVHDMGFMSNIINFQIQFHDFVPNALEKKEHAKKILSKTHECTWSYDFIWENWTLKK